MRRWDRMTFLFAPKGPKQSSPGQRPGNLGTTLLRALKGRNGGDITRTFTCTALSGLAVGGNSPSLPRALPWADLSWPLRGVVFPRRFSHRGFEEGGWSREFPALLSLLRGPIYPDAPVLKLRCCSPPRRGRNTSAQGNALGTVVPRPEGAATHQPRATPWEHVNHPYPSPERAKQPPFHSIPDKPFGSSVLKCEAWDFSLFCRSLSFC